MAQVSYWIYSAGYRITEYGEELICWDERCLVVANHQSTADVPAIMALLNGPQKRSAARKALWIIDSAFRFTPFGVIGQVHGDTFLTEGRTNREYHLENLRNHLSSVFWERDRRWVLVFPEGGFLYKRREGNAQYAERNDFPRLEYSVLPKTGAVRVILDVLGPKPVPGDKEEVKGNGKQKKRELLKATLGAIREKKYIIDTKPPVKYLIDMTIAYKSIEDPPGLHTICLGISEPSDIKVYYRVFNIEEIPVNSDDAFRDWMYDLWGRKDTLLRDYYSTGIFAWGEEGRTIRPRWWKMATQHSFFIASGYLYWRFLLFPLLSFFKKMILPDWFWMI